MFNVENEIKVSIKIIRNFTCNCVNRPKILLQSVKRLFLE